MLLGLQQAGRFMSNEFAMELIKYRKQAMIRAKPTATRVNEEWRLCVEARVESSASPSRDWRFERASSPFSGSRYRVCPASPPFFSMAGN